MQLDHRQKTSSVLAFTKRITDRNALREFGVQLDYLCKPPDRLHQAAFSNKDFALVAGKSSGWWNHALHRRWTNIRVTQYEIDLVHAAYVTMRKHEAIETEVRMKMYEAMAAHSRAHKALLEISDRLNRRHALKSH